MKDLSTKEKARSTAQIVDEQKKSLKKSLVKTVLIAGILVLLLLLLPRL